jgi:hypothetical protein
LLCGAWHLAGDFGPDRLARNDALLSSQCESPKGDEATQNLGGG